MAEVWILNLKELVTGFGVLLERQRQKIHFRSEIW